jgi:hypothetical protein
VLDVVPGEGRYTYDLTKVVDCGCYTAGST